MYEYEANAPSILGLVFLEDQCECNQSFLSRLACCDMTLSAGAEDAVLRTNQHVDAVEPDVNLEYLGRHKHLSTASSHTAISVFRQAVDKRAKTIPAEIDSMSEVARMGEVG